MQEITIPLGIRLKFRADASNDFNNLGPATASQRKAEFIEQTFLETNGNVAKAMRILDLSASYLHRMIRQGIVKRS